MIETLIADAIAFLPAAFEIAFAVIAAASVIAAATPTPRDDEWVGRIYRIIDMLALNVGYAKDKAERSAGGRFVAD